MWYLDYDNSGLSDFKVKWGDSNDIPVAGDWDNDGYDEIGLYRPSTQMWYLDYDNSGLSDYKVKWGDSTDKPVTGDWDGDARDEIGLYRPSTQMWYLDYDNSGLSDFKVKWGDSTDKPVAGKFQIVVVTGISPDNDLHILPTDNYQIFGDGFMTGAQVVFIREDYSQTIPADGESVTNSTFMTCTVDHDLISGIREGATYYHVRVTNPNGYWGQLNSGYYTYEIW
jgi:hypothetical protein